MRASKLLKNLIYLLIMSSFLFDSYIKLTNVQKEGDLLRSKYQRMQDFLKSQRESFELPLSYEFITLNATTIVSVYAILQFLLAVIVILGQRQVALGLIGMTVMHTFVMHNPYYRNTTDLDRERCFKNIFNDLCMIAILFIVTDMKKPSPVEVSEAPDKRSSGNNSNYGGGGGKQKRY